MEAKNPFSKLGEFWDSLLADPTWSKNLHANKSKPETIGQLITQYSAWLQDYYPEIATNPDFLVVFTIPMKEYFERKLEELGPSTEFYSEDLDMIRQLELKSLIEKRAKFYGGYIKTAGWGAGSEPGIDLMAMDKQQLADYIADLWKRYDASNGRDRSKVAYALRTLSNIDLPNLHFLGNITKDETDDLIALVEARGPVWGPVLQPETQLPNPGLEPKP